MMPQNSYTMEHGTHHGITVLNLAGQLNLDSSQGLARDILMAIPKSDPFVVLDLTGVTYSDSSGIGTLANIQTRVTRAGGRMAICGVHGNLADLMRVCNIGDVFAMYPSLEEACAWVRLARDKHDATH